MKVAIYSPYLDTFGGGEKYMATIAEAFSTKGEIDIFLDKHLNSFGTDFLKRNLEKRFGLNLKTVNFKPVPIGEGSNFFQRLSLLKGFDLFFYLTDGSIFYPSAKKNILHIQTPLVGQANSLFGKIKLRGWDLIIYNSEFTKEHAEKNWSIPSYVIYPPVDVNRIKVLPKKKYIISVGRFFGYLKNKKHELLIKTFKRLYEKNNLKDWSLHIVGGMSDGDKLYFEQLKKLAGKLPVKFYPNLEYDKLMNLYGESKIYWHAQGFMEDDPTKMEHFGITTVEAMAGGCVPVVIGAGGQKEIIEDGKSGFLWNSLDGLESLTLKLAEDQNLWKKLSQGARRRSEIFSKERFVKEILSLA